MTQVLAGSVALDAADPVRVGLPELGRAVIIRVRLSERLREGSRGLLTVVEGPTGAGKTLGVAGWATESTSASGVLWLGADACRAGVHSFWSRFRSGLLDLGAGPLPPVPSPPQSPRSADPQWTDWLSTFGDALRAGGGTWVVVLDDYPSAPCGWLEQQIAALLTRSGPTLRLVVTCTRMPALAAPVARLARGYSHITPDELRMDEQEVADILSLHGVTVDGGTASSLRARVYGWARGIGIAARAMQTSSWPDVIDQLDAQIHELLEREVVGQFSAAGRELIIRTSVASDVSPGLARAVMGADVQLAPALVACRNGFVEAKPDGSFRCHPLLRRTALRRLDQDWPALARGARSAAASWYVANGELSAGIELAADVDDWTWLAGPVVGSMVVPSIILGAAEQTTARAVARNDIGTAEPLLAAALAVSRGNLPAAEAAMARADEGMTAGPGFELARRLSAAVISMAIARQRADHVAGLRWVDEARGLVPKLTLSAQHSVPELARVLDAHEGAFRLWSGDLDRAFAILEPPADLKALSGAEQVAAADCVGLLAWMSALRGNLTAAARHAAEVLTIRPADGRETGVGYAQLAAAWVHLERGELDQARQRLTHVSRASEGVGEPWLATAQRLAEARVTTAGGEPDAALRLLSVARRAHPTARMGWLADRFTVATAEAHLASGDHQQVLAALTPEPRHTLVEARVLAAAARRAIGDKRGSRALLTAVEGDVAEAPLPAAVQLWSLEAQLAVEAQDNQRARSLLGRALREASREELRLALSLVTPWMPAFVDRDPGLSRAHRTFVASLTTTRPERRTVEQAGPPDALFEPLSERELQVLERLALLCTTDEIARDLFVSVNTVKTHIKSLFVKLSVNRRADAVRRGRGLALC